MTVLDLNVTTGVTRSEYMYWSASDDLLARYTTPNTASPTTFSVEFFTHVEPIATGVMRLDYPALTEARYYDVHAPLGLPIARYQIGSVDPTVTSTTWTGEFYPFGELKTETGTTSLRPPWRFEGQLELTGSDARYWNGATNAKLRETLYLNRWRVLDSRLGQYLSPEPLAVELSGAHVAYAYASLLPIARIDPSGLDDYMDGLARSGDALCDADCRSRSATDRPCWEVLGGSDWGIPRSEFECDHYFADPETTIIWYEGMEGPIFDDSLDILLCFTPPRPSSRDRDRLTEECTRHARRIEDEGLTRDIGCHDSFAYASCLTVCRARADRGRGR
jgi:RHS repeat-associated protein